MIATKTAEPAGNRLVGMGQMAAVRHPGRLTAVLGSCVGLTLHCPRLKLGAMAHIVLPKSHAERAAAAGKFADTAVPALLAMLEAEGALRREVTAKMFGGACMFGGGGPLQIGDENVKATRAALDAAGLRPMAENLCGNAGRRISLDCNSGAVTVEMVGCPSKTY
jgi:chemotaxis protein CheD